MEVSGQLHAPAALSPGKEPQVPIGEEAGWSPEPGLILSLELKLWVLLKFKL
jgi:hypothetical protein